MLNISLKIKLCMIREVFCGVIIKEKLECYRTIGVLYTVCLFCCGSVTVMSCVFGVQKHSPRISQMWGWK